MTSPGKILIRADAGPHIGVGHVMRCLGLAQAWQERGGQVAYASTTMPDSLSSRLSAEGIKVHTLAADPASRLDAELTKTLTEAADWLLVDGYNFGSSWLRQVRGKTRIALWTDHAHATELPVDLILNQNPHASHTLYASSAPSARLLLGPEFVVLRREFRESISRRTSRSALNRVLVTFGGGVAAGAHDAFLDAAELLGERLPATTLLIGQNHPARDLIFERAARLPAVTARLTSDNFTSFVEASDLAVSAAGATLWELASLGLPSLALVIAENQEPLAQHLQFCGAGVSLGQLSGASPTLIANHINHLSNHSESLTAMSRAALALVDGKGAQRVCDALTASL